MSGTAATGGAVDVERVARAVNRYAQAWQDAGAHSADEIPDSEYDRLWSDPLDAARQGLADALGVPERDLMRWLM